VERGYRLKTDSNRLPLLVEWSRRSVTSLQTRAKFADASSASSRKTEWRELSGVVVGSSVAANGTFP
jgi:hypothetical protein